MGYKDAADALAKGWTSSHITELERTGKLFGVASAPAAETKVKAPAKRAAKSKTDTLPSGFRLTHEGVFYSGEDGESRPVCSPLEILARTRDAKGHNWGLLVHAPAEMRVTILQSYFQGFESTQRARLVTRLGWHDSAFLLPEQQVGSHTEHLHFYEAGA